MSREDLTLEVGWPYSTMHFSPTEPETNGSEVILEAHGLINGLRQDDYGHPLDDFTKTAIQWEVILGVSVSPEQVGLCMISVKISRHLNAPKADNLTDIAGYAGTLGMIAHERARRLGEE